MPKITVIMIHNESVRRKMELIGEMELAAVPSLGEDLRHKHMGVVVISKVCHVHYGDNNRVDIYINPGITIESFHKQHGSMPTEDVR
jgi:hypothetical protein